MATVQLSDIINVTVFKDLPAVDGVEKTELWQSGVIVKNTLLDELASAPGKTAELPFWNDLDATSAPNLSTDNPSDVAVPDKVTQGEQISRKAFLNKGWSASDLASELAMGPKAMSQIRSRTDTYWKRQFQRRLIATAQGVLADNIAANSSDMVFSPAQTLTANVTANSLFTRANFTAAAFTLGDRVDAISAIAVHSVVFKRMVDNDDIDFIPDSKGQLTIPTYLGRSVIVDDSMPYLPVSGGNAAQYTSILFGQGAFGYGEGSPEVPVEVDRKPEQGNGGGIEILWTRKTWILHPFGFQNTGTPAAQSFTLAELKLATTWARVIERKNIPLAFLVTNG